MKSLILNLLYTLSLFLSSPCFAQTVWANRVNGQGDFSSVFNVVKADAAGATYFGGYTVNTDTYKDMLLVKRNAAGDTVFTRVYDGAGNNADDILDLTLDGSGNIYITGYQFGVNSSGDMVTMKINSSGSLIWKATYNGPNEYDQGNSIALDAAGNVYVTGESDGDTSCVSNYDIVTAKYDANGNQLWAVRKNGLGNGTDKPVKLGIDTSGNVYVAGRSYNGTNDDYILLKYNGSGVQQWQKTYDRSHNDFATAMVIDNTAGAIYVTGRSNSGTDFDYVTLKYNFAGTQLWAAIYNNVGDDRATAVVKDAAGNIYVTGQSDVDATTAVNYNISTVKYNALGVQQWVQTFNGTGNGDDIPNSMAVDNSGNVIITGLTDANATAAVNNDFVTLKYDNAGVLKWSKTFNGATNGNDIAESVAIDNLGNCLIAGSSESPSPQTNATALKYDSLGALLWTKFYTALGDNSDNSHAIAVDDTGNVYIAGYTVKYNADRNFAVFKINSSGTLLWEKDLDGTSTGSTDEAQAIAFDGSGNVYAAGYTHNSCQASDITVAKYNWRGDSIWAVIYNSPYSGTDRAYSLALDASNNVYVTGKSNKGTSTVPDYDIITIKYNNSGSQQWLMHFGGSGDDEGTVVKIASTGNVYVGGKTYNGTDEDYSIVKYNSSGSQQWSTIYNSGNGDDIPLAMVLDNSENIYLTGTAMNPNKITTDIATVKFNSSGVKQWSKVFNGAINGNDQGNSIALDASGNVIITGKTDVDSMAATVNYDYVTIKYDNSGNQLWVATYNGAGNANDESNEVTTDASGNIYVSGQSDNGMSGQNYDYATIKYSSAGALTGMVTYNGTASASDVANTLALKGNNLFVTGGSFGTTTQRDLVTIKYDATCIVGIATSAVTTICSGGSVVLTATTGAGLTYQWKLNGSTISGAVASSYTASGTGNYSCVITNSCGSITSNTISINIVTSATLNLKFFTQGYYASGGKMKQVLFNEAVDPNPLSTFVDTFLVELHHPTSTATIISSYKGLLHTDGTIQCTFPCSVVGNSYYIVIKHRNTIQTWSAAPVAFAAVTNYDFTYSKSKAYANNMNQVVSNVYAFFSSDINQDENIDLVDFPPLDAGINAGSYGYYVTDLNGDGNVDLLDFPLLDVNINAGTFSRHP